MKRFHVALSVADIGPPVADYTRRLGAAPQVVVPGEYALWRTESLNFSIRRTDEAPGTLRHVGWEDPGACGFTAEADNNGLIWESFSPAAQAKEILHHWPAAELPAELRGNE